MPLIVNSIKSEKDDKGHGIDNHDLFLYWIPIYFTKYIALYSRRFLNIRGLSTR